MASPASTKKAKRKHDLRAQDFEDARDEETAPLLSSDETMANDAGNEERGVDPDGNERKPASHQEGRTHGGWSMVTVRRGLLYIIVAALVFQAAFSGVYAAIKIYHPGSRESTRSSGAGASMPLQRPSMSNNKDQSHITAPNASNPLVPFALKPLPLGSIQPLGWLKDQMVGLAEGLAGHQMDFFGIVKDNPWLGGNTEYSSLNEGYPYWFNGLVPMAYQLQDQRLIGQVQDSVSYVLARQNMTTGWLGPETKYNSNNLWARFPFMLGLHQLADADPVMAPQIVNALYRFLPLANSLLLDNQSTTEVWGRARYADFIITLEWLYDTHPSVNGTDQRPLLTQLMQRLRNWGVDWAGYYSQDSYFFQDIDTIYPAIQDPNFYFPYLHGVNVGQGLKTMAVDYRFTGNASLLDTQRDAMNWTLTHHGAASYTVIGDERESNNAPNRGSELCTAVEFMYSNSYAYQVTGEAQYADNAELAAYNALPVMMTADNWAHQYVVQPNGPNAVPIDGRDLFWNVGPVGITYGLEPNYPCCAVNHPQGYPKFVAAAFATVGGDGLAHALLAPASASTTLACGAQVAVRAETAYPFGDVLVYSISASAPFTFYVRTPGWAAAATSLLYLDSALVSSRTASSGGGHKQPIGGGSGAPQGLTPIAIPAGQHSVQYILSSATRVQARANATVAVYHGALLFALDVGFSVSGANATASGVPAQARNYNISSTRAWNFAIDPATIRYFASSSYDRHDNASSAPGAGNGSVAALANPIWDYHAPQQYMTALGCQISWPLLDGAPDIPPPAINGNRTCTGPAQTVFLRPYGSLKVHMAELPTVQLGGH